jgi:VWFA-related protein
VRILTCLLAGLAMTGAAAPRQTFKVSVDAVRVDVLVMDGNRPVGGLTAADFELRDSGVLQQIESVAYEDVPLRLMLALDVSDSVQGALLDDLKDAAGAVARVLAPADRGALLTFAASVELRAGWTGDTALLGRAIAEAETGGSTALHDAAYAALMLRDTEPGRTLVLMFSDGDDTASWLPGQAVIDVARRSDAVVYAVGPPEVGPVRPGYRIDFRSGVQAPVPNLAMSVLLERFLKGVASETGGRYFTTDRSSQLRDTFVKIVTEFRSRYLITYSPREVDVGGWHPIEVKLKTKRGSITARRGYLR